MLVNHDSHLVKTWIHLWPIQVLGHVRGSCNDRRALVRPVSVLLHVLRKIRLLSVTLSTVGADVCLYMFRLLVLRDVLKERLFVGEALVAGVALVRLVTLMASRMRLQVGELRERLRATWGAKRLAELWGKIRSRGFCQKCSLLTGLTDILSGRKKSRNEVELGAPAKRLWEV